MVQNALDARVVEALGHYVYMLKDPRDEEIFYVGRGVGSRLFAHEAEALKSARGSEKLDRIRSIHAAKLRVGYLILRYGLSEENAMLVESVAIDLLRSTGGGLENEIKGYGSGLYGLRKLDDVVLEHAAEPLQEIGNRCVVININKTYEGDEDRSKIYEAVRSSWVIAKERIGPPKNPKLKYVLAEHRQIIVEVYRVDEWFKVKDHNSRPRWAFNGEVAEEGVRKQYLHKKVEKKRGAVNPVTFNL